MGEAKVNPGPQLTSYGWALVVGHGAQGRHESTPDGTEVATPVLRLLALVAWHGGRTALRSAIERHVPPWLSRWDGWSVDEREALTASLVRYALEHGLA